MIGTHGRGTILAVNVDDDGQLNELADVDVQAFVEVGYKITSALRNGTVQEKAALVEAFPPAIGGMLAELADEVERVRKGLGMLSADGGGARTVADSGLPAGSDAGVAQILRRQWERNAPDADGVCPQDEFAGDFEAFATYHRAALAGRASIHGRRGL